MSFYLRCESEITIVEGSLHCSAWQSVSEDELLGALVRSSMLSQEDFWIVGAGVTVIMCTAIGVRVLLKLLFNSSKGNDS
jgi:hypothetical protein